jgi:hypothetical protein
VLRLALDGHRFLDVNVNPQSLKVVGWLGVDPNIRHEARYVVEWANPDIDDDAMPQRVLRYGTFARGNANTKTSDLVWQWFPEPQSVWRILEYERRPAPENCEGFIPQIQPPGVR